MLQPWNPLPRQLLFQNYQDRAPGQGILTTAQPPIAYAEGPSSGAGLSGIVAHESSSRYPEGIPANALTQDSTMHALKPHESHVQGCSGHALTSGPDESHAQGYSRPAVLTTQGSSTSPVAWRGVISPAITTAAPLQEDSGF